MLPTTEVEYIIDNEEGNNMLWLKMFLQKSGLKQQEHVVYCDSNNVMDLNKNAAYHACTKNVDVRYHWIREVIDKNLTMLEKIYTNKNPSDMMMTNIVFKKKLESYSELAEQNSQ